MKIQKILYKSIELDLKVPKNRKLYLSKDNKIYYISNKNEQYTIQSVNGYIKYTEDFEGCIQKMDEISETYSGMFPNAQKNEWKDVYTSDPSGKSILEVIEFTFPSGANINLQCSNIEETFRIKNNWTEGLSIGIDSAEIDRWLRDYK